MLILFVEYHASFRQAASYLMGQESDMEVVSQADSVAGGREKMAEGGIDAALVDIPLPDEGAVELVRELHETNPSIPVLVLTHPRDRHDRVRGVPEGGRRRGALQGPLCSGGVRRGEETRRRIASSQGRRC